MNPMDKLILGTVQFGLDYGVTNTKGKIPESEVSQILSIARNNGIKTLDSAPSYGDSEERIGRNSKPEDFQIISKCSGDKSLVDSVNESLSRLNRENLYGLLFHSPEEVLENNSLFESAQKLKESGKIKKVGLSVYDQQTLDNVLKVCNPDIIQVPLNIFDQRLIKNMTITHLNEKGIEVHARSVFLQGSLLTPIDYLPDVFNEHRTPFEKLETFLNENKISRLQACLQFVIQNQSIDKFLIGVTSTSELNEIISELNKNITDLNFDDLETDDSYVLDPRNWKTN